MNQRSTGFTALALGAIVLFLAGFALRDIVARVSPRRPRHAQAEPAPDYAAEVGACSLEELRRRFLAREIAPRGRAAAMFARARAEAILEALPCAVLYSRFEYVDQAGTVNAARLEAERLLGDLTPDEVADACSRFAEDEDELDWLLRRVEERLRK